MSQEFLEDLGLSDQQVAKLRQLGVADPMTLYSICEASPHSLEQYLGKQTIPRLQDALRRLIGEEELQRFEGLPVPEFATGAVVDGTPAALEEDSPRIRLRERILRDIERVRGQRRLGKGSQARLDRLEGFLDRLLE